MSATNKRKQDYAGLNGGGRPAPAKRWILSSTFNDSTGDVEIRSIDGTRFLLHLSNLAANSKVFADMIEVGASNSEAEDRPIIPLEETAKTLELVFQLFYPRRMSWMIAFPADIPILVCLDKYEIWRGLELVEEHLRNKTSVRMLGLNWAYSYGFFSRFKNYDSDMILASIRRMLFSSFHDERDKLRTQILALNLPTVLQFDVGIIISSIESTKAACRKLYEVQTTKFLADLSARQNVHNHTASDLLHLIRSWDAMDKFHGYGKIQAISCASCRDITNENFSAVQTKIRMITGPFRE